MAEFDEFGGVIDEDKVSADVAEDLGRGTDLSFLGEAAQDPVGAAQSGAEELYRTGELGGLEIQREQLHSEFPMEPGESRAAKELPELFTGQNIMNPRFEELEASLDDPNLGFFAKMGLQMQLRDMAEHGEQTQRVGSGVASHLPMKDKALISAAGMTMFDPAEIAQMLTQVDPETGAQRWPEFGIQTAPDGTLIVANNETGQRAVLNRPGMSATDVIQGLGIAAAFTPAGRATAAMPSLAGRIAVGATTAGATEAAIQQGQEMAGGQFDKGDVALSAAVGPAIDLVRPLAGGIQRTGRFIGSYIPEGFGARLGAATGLDSVLPAAKQQMMQFARNAKQYIQSGRDLLITTQDAVPEAQTPFRQILLKMVERMPLTGTGGLRKAQQQERVEVLQHLADRFHLNPNTNYGARVVDDLNRSAGGQAHAARQTVNTAIDEMADNDVILRDFRLSIKSILDDEEKYGEMANQGVIKLLNRVRNAVWQGGKEQDFNRSFGGLNDWLERLYVESANAPPAAREAITEAADALRRDLTRHATEVGGEAGGRYLNATRQLQTLVNGSEARTLRGLIEAGEVDQQVIRRVLKSGDAAQLSHLAENLTESGQNEARQMIMRNAMRVGGWRRGPAGEAIVDPKKVLNWFESEPVDAQLKAFFPDETAQRELGGMLEYLRATAAAGETGKGVGMAASGGVGQMGANAVNLATLGLVGLAGHAYQSAPVRNLLLRLQNVKSDPRMKDELMRQLSPLLMAGGRQMSQLWTESDPHDMVYVSDEFSEGQDEEPGLLEQGMGALRQATGQTEEGEEAGVTGRLMEMLGEEAPVE